MSEPATRLAADSQTELAVGESIPMLKKIRHLPQTGVGRFAISLRDWMATILVIGLVFGSYKMGIRHAEEAAKWKVDMEMNAHLNERLQDLCRDDRDWAKLRIIIADHYLGWDDPKSFASWKPPIRRAR